MIAEALAADCEGRAAIPPWLASGTLTSVVGSEDYRTPVSEAEQLYAALKLQRVPTMLVKVPDASHGGIAARPSQSAAKASAIIAWFDRYRTKKVPAPVANAGASSPADAR